MSTPTPKPPDVIVPPAPASQPQPTALPQPPTCTPEQEANGQCLPPVRQPETPPES